MRDHGLVLATGALPPQVLCGQELRIELDHAHLQAEGTLAFGWQQAQLHQVVDMRQLVGLEAGVHARLSFRGSLTQLAA